MALSWTALLASIFRDYITDGVPASGIQKPVKADIRTWGTETENNLIATEARVTTLEGQVAPLLYDPVFCGGVPASALTPFDTETYITESRLTVPDDYLQAGSVCRWIIHATKTAAGTATPIIRIRTGTNGNIADSAKCSLTFDAQTAAVDEAWIEIEMMFRSVGTSTSAVAVAVGKISHEGGTTGFSTKNPSIASAVSSGFNSNPSGNASYIGLAINAGTSAAWSIDFVRGRLENLA